VSDPPRTQRIREHLSAVEGSPDWADLAEILAWYRVDVAALLAQLAATHAAIRALRDQWREQLDGYDAGGNKLSSDDAAMLTVCAEDLSRLLGDQQETPTERKG